jgi:hypothetical protein
MDVALVATPLQMSMPPTQMKLLGDDLKSDGFWRLSL